MAFAMCPDGGLPRLFRMVEPGVLPEGIVCHLDRRMNILQIDREKWERISRLDKHFIRRTTHRFVLDQEVQLAPILRQAAE